jgi:23S rRNA pseudouridine1911/1915/1917 synthase
MKHSDKCPYDIIYEDEDLLVVYKKRDVLTIRTEDKKTFSHNLYHYLREYLKKKHESIFIVHRLDYETSGVIVFAKKEEIKISLQKAFENHEVQRFYEAVISERIPLGEEKTVTQYLEEKGLHVFPSTKEKGKEAITILKSSNYIQIGTALDIEIKTGRRNQIRLALQSLGYTLLGDTRYSHSEAKRMYLNAYKLVFPVTLGLKQNVFETKPLWVLK